MNNKKNSTYSINKRFIVPTLLLITSFIYTTSYAQVIFHLDANGPENSRSINRTNVDSGLTDRIISSAPTFTSAHYIQNEDSLLLWMGSDVYKTSRDFWSSRLLTTIKDSWSNISADFDTENHMIYYNFSTLDEDWIYGLDLKTGKIDTVITLFDGNVVDLAQSSFGITYALNLGFGQSAIIHANFEGEADTLHSIDTGSYEKVIADDVNEIIYFVHEMCCTSTNLYQMNMDGSDITLVAELDDNFSDLMVDELSQKLYIRYSNKRVALLDLNANPIEETELFASDYRIDRSFLDPSRNRIVFFSLGGGIIEYDIPTGEFINTAIFQPNENVLLLDEQSEQIYYFAYVNAQSAVYSIDYNGENPQLVSRFNDIYTSTDARDAKLDSLNGHIYFITRRMVKRIALEPGSIEETIISYPIGTSLKALVLDVEKELIYIYKENDGIYSLSFDGESEAVVTTEGRFESNGLAYNPTDDKIFYTSNRHYMVNPDGSERVEWPKFSTLEVDKIMFNPQSDQLLMTQQSVGFDDNMNTIYEERIQYLNFDESLSTGVYVNVPLNSSRYNGITTFSSSFPDGYNSLGTFSQGEFSDKPSKMHLYQNYPNPFNPSTTIRFQLPVSEQVSLQVYDMLGREIAVLLDNKSMTAGSHNVTFNAENQSSGVYIYRLKVADQILTKKLTLIK